MGGEDFWRDVFFCLLFVASGIHAIWKGRIEIELGGNDDEPINPSSQWYRECVGPVARYRGLDGDLRRAGVGPLAAGYLRLCRRSGFYVAVHHSMMSSF